MDSPIRPPPPPPPPAADPVAPSSPPSQHASRDGSLSPENAAPAPAPAPPPPPPPPPAAGPTTASPPHSPGDSSPSSPPHPTTPPPPPPPLPLSTDASPPHPSPAPVPPPPPAPASSDAKSEQEAAESASDSGSMTLALALTQTADSTPPTPPTPPKASSARASPIGSPQKESAVTIAKLLSGEDPAAAEAKPVAEKVAPPGDNGSLAAAAPVAGAGGGGGGGGGIVGSKRWLLGGGVPEKVRHAELRKAELGFRVSAAVFCLVALSVMAADTTTGWSGDSFRRYNEYRYVLAASVVAFTYSGFQLVSEVHYIVTRRHIIEASWRSYFNLAMDQMLAYLLLSASSAALSRNGVWMSRFGGDQFTKLIDASASMAFLAFISLGLSSIISAYSVFSLVS
ncbi:unnamed protein product [Urochloa humidicola]